MKSGRVTAARVTTTDAEIDVAIARAGVHERSRAKIVAARYLAARDAVALRLSTGALIEVPRKAIPRLRPVRAKNLALVEIGPAGATIWFQPADLGFDLEELLLATTGARALRTAGARAMGAISSKKKADAARLNGKRGGRPRK
jgi:uncharacterized protein DUF2442